MHLEQRRQAMLRYDLYYIRGLKVYDDDDACMCVIAGTRTYADQCLKSLMQIH